MAISQIILLVEPKLLLDKNSDRNQIFANALRICIMIIFYQAPVHKMNPLPMGVDDKNGEDLLLVKIFICMYSIINLHTLLAQYNHNRYYYYVYTRWSPCRVTIGRVNC